MPPHAAFFLRPRRSAIIEGMNTEDIQLERPYLVKHGSQTLRVMVVTSSTAPGVWVCQNPDGEFVEYDSAKFMGPASPINPLGSPGDQSKES